MKSGRRRIDVNLDELDQVLDGARQAPLNETDYEKLKSALHTLAAMLVRPRSTEKTSAVLEQALRSRPRSRRLQCRATDAMAQTHMRVRTRSRSRIRI